MGSLTPPMTVCFNTFNNSISNSAIVQDGARSQTGSVSSSRNSSKSNATHKLEKVIELLRPPLDGVELTCLFTLQIISESEHDNDLDNTEVKSCDFAHI